MCNPLEHDSCSSHTRRVHDIINNSATNFFLLLCGSVILWFGDWIDLHLQLRGVLLVLIWSCHMPEKIPVPQLFILPSELGRAVVKWTKTTTTSLASLSHAVCLVTTTASHSASSSGFTLIMEIYHSRTISGSRRHFIRLLLVPQRSNKFSFQSFVIVVN